MLVESFVLYFLHALYVRKQIRTINLSVGSILINVVVVIAIAFVVVMRMMWKKERKKLKRCE